MTESLRSIFPFRNRSYLRAQRHASTPLPSEYNHMYSRTASDIENVPLKDFAAPVANGTPTLRTQDNHSLWSSLPEAVIQAPPTANPVLRKPLQARVSNSSSQPQTASSSTIGAPSSPTSINNTNIPLSSPVLPRTFSRRKQRFQLFIPALLNFALTMFFIGIFVAICRSYEGAWVFKEQGKNWFNTLMTGFSIGFSIHLLASMKILAGSVRWFILATSYRPLAHVNLILNCDSQRKIVKLLWKTRDLGFPRRLCPSWIQVCGISWLLLNLGFQIGVALLSLTYSVDESQKISLHKGPVLVPNLAAFAWRNNSAIATGEEQQYAAHSLGLIGSSMYFGSGQDSKYLGPVQDITTFTNSSTRTIYEEQDGWTYRMVDSSPDNKTSLVTDRTVRSTFQCESYDVEAGVGGESELIIVPNHPEGRKVIYVGPAQPGASNYVTRTGEDCGPRCARVQVFQAAHEPEIPSAGFFDCNITISTVNGSYHEAHELSDPQAKIAAASIAFGGSRRGYLLNKLEKKLQDLDLQYQVYPNNAYGANSTGGNKIDMGKFISSFAIQTIASVGAFVPRVSIETGKADSPASGFGLSLHWSYAIPIFVLIAMAHLVVIVITLIPACRVYVHDDSPLAMARLLNEQIRKLGPGSSLASGAEIAEDIGGSVAYGSCEPEDIRGKDYRRLTISQDVEVQLLPKFSEGEYKT